MEIVKQLTEEFKLRPDHAENVVKLLTRGIRFPLSRATARSSRARLTTRF